MLQEVRRRCQLGVLDRTHDTTLRGGNQSQLALSACFENKRKPNQENFFLEIMAALVVLATLSTAEAAQGERRSFGDERRSFGDERRSFGDERSLGDASDGAERYINYFKSRYGCKTKPC